MWASFEVVVGRRGGIKPRSGNFCLAGDLRILLDAVGSFREALAAQTLRGE